MTNQAFMIVGAGLAGAKAAAELRTRGFDRRIVLIGAEPERPYERPPLSKEYLRGEAPREQTYVHPADFYEQHQIELVTGVEATRIDSRAQSVELADGRSLRYERLLLSTGAEPRRLTVPGAELDGIHYLRTIADSDALRQRLAKGGSAAVIGAGWIGSEFAASARSRGLEVTVIDPARFPNERIFGPEIGAFYRDLHVQHGVELALGEGIEALEGDGAVRQVRTSSGRVIECDFAVVGIGAVPRVGLAEQTGLELDGGIAVDERLRSSAPGVFAAGDVASAWHPFYGHRIRVEHWANALNQGPSAAASMLGDAVSYDRLPYFFSDQYDVGMEYSGYATRWEQLIVRGDPQDGAFVAFWLDGGRVVAGMNVNVWDVNEHVQALIRSRQPVPPEALGDPDTPLESLAAAVTP